MTKETGGGVLLADSTRARLRSGAGQLVRGGEIEVRGRTETLMVWHLQANPAEAEKPVEAAATP
jgi:class 3 adenylate cyclase